MPYVEKNSVEKKPKNNNKVNLYFIYFPIKAQHCMWVLLKLPPTSSMINFI